MTSTVRALSRLERFLSWLINLLVQWESHEHDKQWEKHYGPTPQPTFGHDAIGHETYERIYGRSCPDCKGSEVKD